MASTHSFQMPVSFNQIIELVKQLPREQKNKLIRFLKNQSDTDEIIIPEWHKEVVEKRMASAKPEDYIPWSKAKKTLKYK